MAKVGMIAKLTAADGKREELIAAFDEYFPAVEGEPGTEVYILHEDVGDANVVWFYEVYTDEAALAAHGGSDAMKELGPKLGGLLAGRPELSMLRPRRIKGETL